METEDNENKSAIESEACEYDETISSMQIAEEPKSSNSKELVNYANEQGKDKDLVWIKEMILKYGDNKPKIVDFENRNQKALYSDLLKIFCTERQIKIATSRISLYFRNRWLKKLYNTYIAQSTTHI